MVKTKPYHRYNGVQQFQVGSCVFQEPQAHGSIEVDYEAKDLKQSLKSIRIILVIQLGQYQYKYFQLEMPFDTIASFWCNLSYEVLEKNIEETISSTEPADIQIHLTSPPTFCRCSKPALRILHCRCPILG
jgi:hypothetical protein